MYDLRHHGGFLCPVLFSVIQVYSLAVGDMTRNCPRCYHQTSVVAHPLSMHGMLLLRILRTSTLNTLTTMPALTLHLFSLTIPARAFLQSLRQHQIEVVVASRPQHIVIHPSLLDTNTLTSHPWDLLALLRIPGDVSALPSDLQKTVRDEYKILTGIPSKLLSTYPERDAKLKRETSSIPLTGSLEKAQSQARSTSQNLEVSPELLAFMERLTREYGDKPVTMLNLLHFHHPNGKQSYYQYGQAFVPVAGKRGGSAKLVGNVVKPSANVDSRGDASRPEHEWWNEISIVHYPSIRHFCDMLAGEDYQAINERYRLSVSVRSILWIFRL